MIFWIASYPKSGNTWLRALISSYYYSKNGTFNDALLKKIDQFPTKKYFNEGRHKWRGRRRRNVRSRNERPS